jgi:hypothetical protein
VVKHPVHVAEIEIASRIELVKMTETDPLSSVVRCGVFERFGRRVQSENIGSAKNRGKMRRRVPQSTPQVEYAPGCLSRRELRLQVRDPPAHEELSSLPGELYATVEHLIILLGQIEQRLRRNLHGAGSRPTRSLPALRARSG